MGVKRSWNWGPRVQIGGIPGMLGGRTKQTEAAWAKGTVPLRYFICVCLFLFFGGGKGTGWKGDRKTKSKREKKKHDFPPTTTPGPRPELMRVRMSTHTAGEQQ